MPGAVSRRPGRVRPLCRQAVRPEVDLYFRTVRPSLLDMRFTGDAWIVDGRDGTLGLFLGDYRLASIAGVALDVPSLNQQFEMMRHRRARRR